MSLLLTKLVVRIWEYRVSHKCLLPRSPKGETEPTNLDIQFVG
jgi:hypothetical protein